MILDDEAVNFRLEDFLVGELFQLFENLGERLRRGVDNLVLCSGIARARACVCVAGTVVRSLKNV